MATCQRPEFVSQVWLPPMAGNRKDDATACRGVELLQIFVVAQNKELLIKVFCISHLANTLSKSLAITPAGNANHPDGTFGCYDLGRHFDEVRKEIDDTKNLSTPAKIATDVLYVSEI